MMRRFFTAVAPEFLMMTGIILGLASIAGQKSPGAPRIQGASMHPPARLQQGDCGPVSLYVLCKWSGRPHSLEELRHLANTSIVGTDMYHLKEATAALGFQVQACKCSFENLWMHVSRPKCYAILHSSKLHYISVIRGVDDMRVRIVDADLGVQDLGNADLGEIFEWDGTALLLTDK